MHLKTLTLRGFKSFAGATKLELEPGITCVVGPNGSGKSNVVDALAWVMGEQGAKNLRGGNMSDVIFAGTSTRAGLGRAQVSLTIDNSDGALPIDYSEVTISRTMFRSGGSEYAINGSACRLLDIQELLSDTGMGRQMHVIVGQGQLDNILTATPLQRRGFIEEAAGVLKHRRRRERAAKKLEGLAEKLSRLEDLTAEVKRQLGPLARQASLARRASVIQATEADARLRLLADDIVAAKARLSSHDDSAHVFLRKREELTKARSEQSEVLAKLEAERRKHSPLLRNTGDLLQEAATMVERYRASLALINERARSLAQSANQAPMPDLEQLASEVQRAETLDLEAEKQVKAIEAEREQARLALQRAEQELAAASKQLKTSEQVNRDAQSVRAKLQLRVNSARIQLEGMQEAQENGLAELEEAKKRLSVAQAELAAAPQVPSEDTAGASLGEIGEKRDLARQKLVEKTDALAAATRALSTWQARLETLEQTLESLARGGNAAEVSFSALAGSIRVDSYWQSALAGALGPFANAVIWPTWDAGREALAKLSDHAQHFAAIAQNASGSGQLVEVGQEPPAAKPEVVAAHRAVTVTDEALVGALSELLADTFFAPDAQTAREFLASSDQRARVVTRDGEILGHHSWGRAGDDSSAIHIENSRLEAAEQVRQLQKSLRVAETEKETAERDVTELDSRYQQQLQQMRAADRERADIAAKVAALTSAVNGAKAEIARQSEQLEKAAERIEAAKQLLAEAEQAYKEAPAGIAADVLDRQGEAVNQARIALDAAREVETNLRVQEHQERERARGASGRARMARQNLANAKQTVENRKRELAAANASARRLEALEELLNRGLKVAVGLSETLREKRKQLDERLAGANSAIDTARAKFDEIEQQLEQIVATTHRDEVMRAELVLAVDQCMNRIDDQGMNEEALLANYGPHLLVPGEDPDQPGRPFVRAEQEQIAKRAQAELKRLGAVNPLALEEHKAAQQRYDYLAGQLADLKKSRSDLIGLLRDIDNRVDAAFSSAFADTQQAFIEVFATLFPGGEGKLRLVEDPEGGDAGVEIEARPAGKKVKRLSLLSGGERSLAALAYVIAIFKARPSPFYVMDEVEAALDDANLGRILTIFEQLRQTSQLLIITHQNRTMEAADALYGVSMREGVTTVVSQRLSDN